MTLRQYYRILTKRWYIVLICFFVVGLGTFIGSKLMKPLYQSSALVQVAVGSVSSGQSNYNDLQASNQLVQTEADLATSDSVLRSVVSHYPGLTVNQLVGEVSSTIKLNTQLFQIDVVDSNPDQGAKLANDIAMTLIRQQQEATQQQNVQAQQQIQQHIDQTSQQINDTTTKLFALQANGGSQGEIALLQAQLSSLQQRYTQLQTAFAQLELAQAESGNPLRIVQLAQPAATPVRPNILLYTSVGLLLGLMLGMLLVVVFEQFDTRVRTPEEITQFLAWPVLATIRRDRSMKAKAMLDLLGQYFNVESFRMLRTNIGFSSIDKQLHSMIVTSAQQGDGKSTIAAHLAIFIAKAGKSTLLIDGDLRRPILHTLFNLSPDRLGFSNAVLALSTPGISQTSPSNNQFIVNTSTLQSHGGPSASTVQFSLEPFLHTVGIPNLWVMPSGPLPPSPSEFLESKMMQRFLTVIENCGVEIVIFDTSPLLGLSDTSILASKVDSALVVVDTARATKEKLKQVKEAISQTGVYVLGCVANKFSHKRSENLDYYAENQASDDKLAKNGHFSNISDTSMSTGNASVSL